jgi:hypothetical protein
MFLVRYTVSIGVVQTGKQHHSSLGRLGWVGPRGVACQAHERNTLVVYQMLFWFMVAKGMMDSLYKLLHSHLNTQSLLPIKTLGEAGLVGLLTLPEGVLCHTWQHCVITLTLQEEIELCYSCIDRPIHFLSVKLFRCFKVTDRDAL